MKRYNPTEIEKKWLKYWDENKVYEADLQSDKPKYIAMSMFNYPSGAGIHIGHAMNYTISDVMARFKRQQGYESYHPVGWDAFGLPAENYAIRTGITPQESMAKIIPMYHKQYKAMGWSNDWSMEISSHLPEYYKWSQWLFEQLYKKGLVYQDARMQWWCDKCQTVLANEQVIDGKCWRHDAPDDPEVTKREVKQWFFKITDYAEKMLDATADLDWSEVVKTAQTNWIGKSVGAEVDFKVKGCDQIVRVFTTRPDTLFGATFVVLSPEHPLVTSLTIDKNQKEVLEYRKQAAKKTEIERVSDTKDKTGVFTGSYAINPATGEAIPIWVADYVLYGYGTGAIMAVPAHDQRDGEFALAHDLPIRSVIDPVAIRDDAKGLEVDVKKDKIVAVVTNKKGAILTINWGPKLGGRLLVGGTIEGDEAPEVCAMREVTEETGYTDLDLVAVGEEIFHYTYYAFSKQQVHETKVKFVHLHLKSDKKVEQKLDDSEKDNFKVEWVNKQTGENEITEPLHRYAFDKYVLNQFYHGEGYMANSGVFDGMDTSLAREEIVAWLETQSVGESKTTYKIRDWSVSRQRYWGAPIPIINCPKCGPVLVPEEDLPVKLPELNDFAPSGDGRSALARATDWVNVKCPVCGEPAQRETDTMDTYICSSWYFLRYLDPHNDKQIFDPKTINKWMPIDFYNGGDHATAHMIYARFITRFLHDIGLVDNPEPFKRFLFNGKVTASDGTMFSKSKGNGVDPLEIINSGYGADALRTYLMFAAPLDLWIRWDPQGVPGTFRFLNRIWNLTQEFIESDKDQKSDDATLKIIHPVIRKVTADLEDQKYNTAIATMMKAVNELYAVKSKSGFSGSKSWQFTLEAITMLVAPFAPHLSEELWHDLGHDDTVNVDHWPMWDDKYLVRDTITIVVQVNGKVRARLDVPTDISEEDVKVLAQGDDHVKTFIGDKNPAKVIYVPGRLVNIVV